MLRRLILPAIVALCAANPALAVVAGNAESQKLLAEGNVLHGQGKFKEALEKFGEARKASPEASAPLSAGANLLMVIAAGIPDDAARSARQQQAADVARAALKLDSGDIVALEVLRLLADPSSISAYQPNAAAGKAYAEGEALFHAAKYEEARAKYREAQRADPKFASAWVMEGDTYFMEKNWLAAEMLFQKATVIDPQSAQAWRFLADTLARLGNRNGVESAALNAIAAQPGQQMSWDRLAMVAQLDKQPLARLQFARRASVKFDPATGKAAISLAEEFKDAKGDAAPERAIWLAYALGQANAQTAAAKAGRTLSPYALEREGWTVAMKMLAEVEAKGQPLPQSPVLLAIRKLYAAGDLDAAILLLMYREAYRPEFEAWKTAHPDGIRQFVAAHRLMP
ncbi:hypothetical protein LJR289_001716 [Pseudoduganella sp. LjRoot289]|uniref:hypothetical protein n=1 Tax=Pseudoduganella sp. LjRoot289 TaxID=3342314 RepID=UPI003ED03B35